jgi:hypothetical protein
MAKKIVQPVEVQASVKGDESVKSFRAQLREAQQEALRLAEAFGETDARTLAAAGKVAQLRDRMDDLNATIAGLHPDRFERIATITGTLANGFAAAQGAAALLGGESEELQKQMVRVQAVMALSQGIAGMKDMGKQISGLAADAKKMLIPAFTSVAGAARAVGAALGIGLIIGGITMLIGLVQKLDLSLDGVSKTDKKLLASQNARLKASQDQVDALDASDNILKAQGKSEKEILQMKIAALNVTISNQKAVIETSKAQADAQYAAAKRNKDILVGILKFINSPIRGILSAVDAIAEKLGYKTGLLSQFDGVIEGMASMAFDPEETKKESDKDIAEMEKGLLAMQNTLAGHKLAIKAIDANAAKEAKAARDAAAAEQAAKDAEHAKKMQDELEAQNKERLEALKAQAKEEERIRKEKEEAEAAHQAYITKLQSDADAYRAKVQFDRLQRDLDGVKRLEEMKAEAVMAGIDFINAITTNANAQSEEERKREFKRRQAFDLANTALSTYFAAQKAYESQFLPIADASSPIRATIAAAMAIASGLGRMAAISKQRYQPGAGLQQPGGGGGGGGIQRPSLPASSTLGGGSQMAGQWNNKIYVTEGDITATQRRVNMLRGASVI